MNARPKTMPVAAVAHPGPATARQRVLDEEWNQEMTRLLREAAELREGRDRERSSEDDLLARHESASLLALIRSHGRPKAKHHVLRPRASRPPNASPS